MRRLSLLVLCACGSDPEVTTLTDVGIACLTEDGELQVDFQECLSSSCDTLVSATCAATLDGTTLTVTSEAVIETEGDECTDDCGFVVATCTGDVPSSTEGVTVSIGGVTADLVACEGLL